MSDAYARLRAYADDLQARFVAQAAWKERHPDWRTMDEDDPTWQQILAVDPFPRTDDVVTAARFLDVLAVALEAYERGGRRDD
jgi:hypothetical protein